MEISDKQYDFLTSDLGKYNFLWGTTGSGKTFIANVRFLYEVRTAPKDSLIMITGNTSESLYDNVIMPLLKIDNNRSLKAKYHKGNERIVCEYNNANIVCIGASNESAYARIQGKNIWLWYADEITKQPQSFIEMALSRLRWEVNGSLESRPMIATLNPDHPLHYVKTDYIDRIKDIQGKQWIFDFTDNPLIKDADAYRKEQSTRYSGHFADRMLYNRWSMPEGCVFPEFDADRESRIVTQWQKPRFIDWYTAADWGFIDYTAVIFGYYDFENAMYCIEDELFIHEETSDKIAKEIKAKEALYFKKPYFRVCDNNLQIIADMQTIYDIGFCAVKKDDKEAQINFVRMLLLQERLRINPRCENMIRQLKNCVWKSNKMEWEHTEKEGHFDLIDALIYFCRSVNISKNPYIGDRLVYGNDNYHYRDAVEKSGTGLEALYR
jgi:PBSX family phage terminase large subunit